MKEENTPKKSTFLAMNFLLIFSSAILLHNIALAESNHEVIIDVKDEKQYKPDWNDLDTRPLPKWYDESKFGIFLHWGVFSVPSFGSEWFWANWQGKNRQYVDFMTKNYPPGFTYQDFAHDFTAEFFDADAWADLFFKAGAKYVVLTSKHHEGFTLWPSKRSFSWNAVDVGPKRDLVGELSKAVRAKGMKFGVYHSLFEWYNPIYLEDKKVFFTKRNYPETKLWPDLMDLINNYEPSVLWTDGDWEAFDKYWKSQEFLAWLYNESPKRDEIVVNDRWGIGIPCHHGDFYSCADRYNPGTLQPHKWENCMTVDKQSWGFRRNTKLSDFMTAPELINEMVSTVSCGGNILMNIGPTKEGTVATIFQERLLDVGKWLDMNGEAIYSTSPWYKQNDTLNSDTWYTCHKDTYDARKPTAPPKNTDKVDAIYAIFLKWPTTGFLVLQDIVPYLEKGKTKVILLGNTDIKLNWSISDKKAKIELPSLALVKSRWAGVLKFF